MKMSCILLSSQNVKIINDNDGSINEGISVQYIMADNLNPVEDINSKSKGYKVSKAWLSPELSNKILTAPAIYEVEFGLNTNSKGKNELRLKDLEIMGNIKAELC